MRQGACVMTLILLVAVFTNFECVGERKITAKTFYSAKKRLQDRLTRLGFLSSSEEHLRTIPSSIFADRVNSSTLLPILNWHRSNEFPDKDPQDADKNNASNDKLNSDVIRDNSYPATFPSPPSLTQDDQTQLTYLIEQHAHLNERDSALYRRHAHLSPKKNDRRHRKKERKREKIRKNRLKKRRKVGERIRKFIRDHSIILDTVDGEEFMDCCPSTMVVTTKSVGKDRTNHAVEVFNPNQMFYERVCKDEIEGRECLIPAFALKRGVVTRCKQMYMYVQTQVRQYMSQDDNWKLDYIQMRAGCACQFSLNSKRKKKKRRTS